MIIPHFIFYVCMLANLIKKFPLLDFCITFSTYILVNISLMNTIHKTPSILNKINAELVIVNITIQKFYDEYYSNLPGAQNISHVINAWSKQIIINIFCKRYLSKKMQINLKKKRRPKDSEGWYNMVFE